ncbi:hypothetical protein ACIO87_32795 [Streptomyces sp. NPDC087218]|uniref:hypothetical protein n=1 Tax=Streptomyces sp. NPDC087218 TaxID=3365769 RepID=UPI00380B7152
MEEPSSQRNIAGSGGVSNVTQFGNIINPPPPPRRRRGVVLGAVAVVATVVAAVAGGVLLRDFAARGNEHRTPSADAPAGSHTPTASTPASAPGSASPSSKESATPSGRAPADPPSRTIAPEEGKPRTSPAGEWVCRGAGFKYPTSYEYGLMPCFRAVDGTLQYTVRARVKRAQTITVHYWLYRFDKAADPRIDKPVIGSRHNCELSLTPGQEGKCGVHSLDPAADDYAVAVTADSGSYDGVDSDVRHWTGNDLVAWSG